MIRRVQMELNQLFLIQMRTSTKKIEKQFQINQNVWLTRNHMSFLIDSFQFYLQVLFSKRLICFRLVLDINKKKLTG
jgi:hypothetical protein